jgi:pimeloyl-ACP methyl ester carboxylesterase
VRQVGIATARNGEVKIAYETFGASSGQPLLLVMGLGVQMLFWPDDLCAALADAGFAVARFDNRDTGLSSRFSTAGVPSLFTMLTRPAAAAVYRLEDMADDAVSVLDALEWDSAHIVGVSLGAMIAQTIAIRYPARVRTLTCISSTPYWRIGRKKLSTSIRTGLARIGSGRPRTAEQFAEQTVRGHRVIGSPGYPLDEPWLRQVGHRMFERGGVDPGAARRQGAAILAAGDLRPDLGHVNVPTLVLHGEDDPLIRIEGGRALAGAIPGAELVTLPGMGHDLPRLLWPTIISNIRALADRR